MFSPREPATNSQAAVGAGGPRLSKSDRARAILSAGTTTSAVDNQEAALREFQGHRPDGGEYVAFERLESEKLPQAATVFLFEPPLAHQAQNNMVYAALRDAYGLSESAIDALTNTRVEASPVGKALVVDDERYTYIFFSARASDEDRRWGALTVWRKLR